MSNEEVQDVIVNIKLFFFLNLLLLDIIFSTIIKENEYSLFK